jgi:RTX calcium-binding nonapeptide repeat (4 copies)
MGRLLAGGLLGIATSLLLAVPSQAARIQGTQGPDRLVGTANDDDVFGRGGSDRLVGRGGHDLLHGGPGRDGVVGETGNDRVVAHYDGAADSVACGPGRDVVTAEAADLVAADCEVVSLQISRDTFEAFPAQHETQVEPDSFAVGQTIVTAFQTGRFEDGGASGIGWATSRDGGRTWRSGFLPSLTVYSTPSGSYDAASDPVVAYDAAARVWLIASLGVSERQTALLVSRSRDGLAWSGPVVAASSALEDYDKEWIVCDNWPTSPFRGRCYLSYLDFESGQIRTRHSGDGGVTWSGPTGVPGRTESNVANGVQPVVRPDGSLVLVFAAFAAFARFDDPRASEMVAVVSSDGGVRFSRRVRISGLEEEVVIGVRAPPLPSVEVDAGGTIYAAWHDCRFRPGCLLNDIVLARSVDGFRWSGPVRVPTVVPERETHVFVPGLGVDPTTSGQRTRLAVAYHVKPQDCGFVRCPGLHVELVTSADAGATWSRPDRLSAEPMPLEWLAETGLGHMTGDYISTSFVAGRPVPVFSLATQPVAGRFQQAIFATTRLVAPTAPRR